MTIRSMPNTPGFNAHYDRVFNKRTPELSDTCSRCNAPYGEHTAGNDCPHGGGKWTEELIEHAPDCAALNPGNGYTDLCDCPVTSKG